MAEQSQVPVAANGAEPSTRPGRRPPLFPLSRRASFAVAAGLFLVVVLWALDVQGALATFLRWLADLGWASLPLFFVLHVAAVVLLIPGIAFPLGAGFLYGPVAGTVISAAGKTLGAVIAFFIARYLLDDRETEPAGPAAGATEEPSPSATSAADDRADRARARRRRIAEFKRRHPKLLLLDRHLPEGGWRVVMLIRLVPVIPFKLSNYFFGWSRFRRRDFVLGTALGTLPYSFTNAWLGALAADLSALTSDPLPRGPAEWALYGFGLLLALLAAALITRRARRILAMDEEPATTGQERMGG
ncbi:MAG: TVP38/TMEM64 family protein [Acidobacteria bacterium]|nr:MAG: TVP38/TMEM64 family protein [Acidobacteriota bacterium]REK03601.1 MAG: TVP38/TMEM64 family protein [Acidobacteriota bacterium]